MIQFPLEFDSLFSATLLVLAVFGRNVDRRDLELSREVDSPKRTASLLIPNILGADEKRWDEAGKELNSEKSEERIGVAGCEILRRGKRGTVISDDHVGPFEPGHLRFPGRELCKSI